MSLILTDLVGVLRQTDCSRERKLYEGFDRLVDSPCILATPVELKIIEDFSEFEDDAVGEVELQVDDTMTSVAREYVDNTVTDLR